MRTIDKVRLDNSATLALETGFNLGWAPGSAQYLIDIPGWFGSAPVRRFGSELMNNHGNHSERGFKDARLISVMGHYVATDRRDALAKIDTLNAYLGDGTRGIFQVEDADLGTRWVRVYLATGGLDVKYDGGVDVGFTIHLEAPDPRKYGGEVVSPATGIPTPGDGLVFPLFSNRPANTVTRTNHSKNPSLEVNTFDWLGNSATIARVTTEAHVGAASLSVLTNGTSGSGAYKNADAIAGSGWAVGDPCSGSVWVKAPAGSIMAGSIICLGGATGSPAVTWTASGAWEKITMINGTIPATVTSVPYVWVRANSAHAAFTFYVDELLIEKASTPGAYFSGANPLVQVDPDTIQTYAWTGAANASTSTETTTDYAGPGGALDLGGGGNSGKVSVTNTGTADTGVVFTVTGDFVPEFTITQEGTGRRLVYGQVITTGQTLTLDSNNGTVTLDGYAPRETELTVAEWSRLDRGETGTWLFEAPGSINATMSAKVVQAWW